MSFLNKGINLNEDSGILSTNQMNVLTYFDLYQRLKAIALIMFKWENLPEGIPPEFLEMGLYTHGIMGFINDPMLGFMITKIVMTGKLNIYEQPVKYRAYATEYNKQFERDEMVEIKNNYLLRPTHETIQLYANRIYEVERSTEVNIKLQKFPLIIRGPKNMLQTLKNVFMKMDGNHHAIYVDSMLDENSIKAIKTDVPFIADKMISYKHELWNECLTFLGINNIKGEDKKERLIVDEVDANTQLIELSADIMLASRQQAVDEINKKFGLDIKVSLRRDIKSPNLLDLYNPNLENDEPEEVE